MGYSSADIDIINQALRRVGSEGITLADADAPTTKPAKAVVAYYDATIKEVLRIVPWNSAIKRSSVLGVSDTTTSYTRKYNLSAISPYPRWSAATAYSQGQMVYIKPSTTAYWYVCILSGTSGTSEPSTTTAGATITESSGVKWACLGAISNTVIRTLDINGDPSIPYRLEGTSLYCNEASPITLRYIGMISPPYTDSILAEAIVSRLASKIAYSLTGDLQISQICMQEYQISLALAKQLSVSEDRADVIDVLALYAQAAQLALKMNKTVG